MILRALMYICRFNFGRFETEEFKKFLKMGMILAIIIGVYWTLKPLKDAVFIHLVDKMHIPYAKTISLLGLLPLVMGYTRLLEKTSREKMLIILPTIYSITTLLFSGAIYLAQTVTEETLTNSIILWIAVKVLGYLWYLFVESFGCLMVALFWAFATDITEHVSAKRGFPLIVAMGQMGGVICPYSIGGLPHRINLDTDALSILILSILCIGIIFLVRYFIKTTSTELLVSFHGKNEQEEEKTHKTGFLEGLKLLLKHKYLIAMFSVNFIYEFILTIFDFNFKVAAGSAYSGVALSNYLSLYASSVNIVSLGSLLLGISNITRFLGIGVALGIMPVIVGIALFSFLTMDSLSFLFALMVGSKAINYALNGPALKQLYIPTTKDIRFKAQAWVETFGSRVSKEAGSIFNMLLNPLQTMFGAVAGRANYLILSGVIGFPLLIVWLIIAMYLSKQFYQAIKDKKVVC